MAVKVWFLVGFGSFAGMINALLVTHGYFPGCQLLNIHSWPTIWSCHPWPCSSCRYILRVELHVSGTPGLPMGAIWSLFTWRERSAFAAGGQIYSTQFLQIIVNSLSYFKALDCRKEPLPYCSQQRCGRCRQYLTVIVQCFQHNILRQPSRYNIFLIKKRL